MALKTIIFDLGNVIVDIDANRTQQGLTQLGITQAHDIFSVQAQNALCDQFECGFSTPDAFIRELAAYSTHDAVDLAAVQRAWESMILQSHPERLALLKACREHYNVYLLSNTNQIHYDHVNNLFSQLYGVKCLDDLFDKAYYSFDVGMRKPMPEFFKHVLEEQRLNPHETVFIDDLDKNIEAAKQLQIHTFHALDMDKTWAYVRSLLKQND